MNKQTEQMRPQTRNRIVLLSISIIILTFPQHLYSSSNFIQCLTLNSQPQTIPIYSSSNSTYNSILNSSIQNLRFSSKQTPKPFFIVTPTHISHVQATVICCKQNGLNLRTLSGGHDYEGLSYATQTPFIVLDLLNFRSITIDADENTAWVEAGASLGELYYRVAEASPGLGFPAGLCTTVGVGGHFSGGGFGTMMRKYGLSADHVVDALVVDSSGRVLDRESMGEGLFWAIRGGGGSSFCVVLSWKVRLVYVPPIVTVFDVAKRLDEHGTKLVHKWQFVGPKFDDNLFIRAVVEEVGDDLNESDHQETIRLNVRFNCMFLGRADELVEILNEEFPELGLTQRDCMETSWIGSVMFYSGYPKGTAFEAFIDRKPQQKYFYKAKSDFVKEPLSIDVLEKLWEWCLEEEKPVIIMEPFGGKMDEISESELPFPHRRGNLYNIQYYVKWVAEKSTKSHVDWIRSVYDRMTPHVSTNPRASYINYRDLDLGVNTCNSNYTHSQKWGVMYFKANFKRLTIVKAEVDPLNFFRDEQSVPPLFLETEGREIQYE